MNDAAPRSRVLERLTRPPGPLLAVASSAAGLTLAYGCSVPALYFGAVMAGVATIAVAAGLWCVRAAASVVAGVLLGAGWMHGFRRLAGWRWWVAPGIIAALAVVAASGAPAWLGWRSRLGWLAPIADAWRRDPRGVAGLPGADRVASGSDGLPTHPLDLWFPAPGGDQPTREADAGFAVWVQGTGFLFERGYYVYAPTLAAGSPLRPHLRALGDGWYAGRLADD